MWAKRGIIESVGTNKRFPHMSGELEEMRHLREASKAGRLQSLTPRQVKYGNVPVTTLPPKTTVWGLAWIRFGETDVHSTVRIIRWTENAVNVEVDIDGAMQRCWIWKGACEPLAERREAW